MRAPNFILDFKNLKLALNFFYYLYTVSFFVCFLPQVLILVARTILGLVVIEKKIRTFWLMEYETSH